MEKQIMCQECRNHCTLLVNDENGVVTVVGNRCPRGEKFGQQEFSGQQQVVSGYAKTTVPGYSRAAVATDRPIPKGMVYKVVLGLKRITISQPMKKGDIVLENICSTGANVVLTQAIGTEE